MEGKSVSAQKETEFEGSTELQPASKLSKLRESKNAGFILQLFILLFTIIVSVFL